MINDSDNWQAPCIFFFFFFLFFPNLPRKKRNKFPNIIVWRIVGIKPARFLKFVNNFKRDSYDLYILIPTWYSTYMYLTLYQKIYLIFFIRDKNYKKKTSKIFWMPQIKIQSQKHWKRQTLFSNSTNHMRLINANNFICSEGNFSKNVNKAKILKLRSKDLYVFDYLFKTPRNWALLKPSTLLHSMFMLNC